MTRDGGTIPTPRFAFVTLSEKRFAEVVTTLRRTFAYLPDDSAIQCDVRALLEALEERCDA